MKCAGSSVEYTLLQNCGEEALCTGGIGEEEKSQGYVQRNNVFVEEEELKFRFHSHTWPALFFERIAEPLAWKDYQCVTIVRNPWDSLVSYYWWSVFEKSINGWMEIKEEDSKDQVKWKFENFLMLQGKTEAIRPEKFYVNESPIDYFSKINEEFIDDSIDFYMSFEKIQKDFDELNQKLCLPQQKLAKFKTKFRKMKKLQYTDYYNSVTRDAVAMRFPKTIQKFGYRF
mgnify:CR=1 FL=1